MGATTAGAAVGSTGAGCGAAAGAQAEIIETSMINDMRTMIGFLGKLILNMTHSSVTRIDGWKDIACSETHTGSCR